MLAYVPARDGETFSRLSRLVTCLGNTLETEPAGPSAARPPEPLPVAAGRSHRALRREGHQEAAAGGQRACTSRPHAAKGVLTAPFPDKRPLAQRGMFRKG